MNLSSLQAIVNRANASNIANTNALQVQTSAATTQPGSDKDSYDSQLKEVAKKYDITHITAQEAEQMAYELNDKGLIDVGDFAVLAAIPHFIAKNDETTMQSVGPDGCINLLNYWKDTIVPSFAHSGLELFDKLIADRQEAGLQTQGSLPTTYREAIDTSTRDYRRVGTLLESLAGIRQG